MQRVVEREPPHLTAACTGRRRRTAKPSSFAAPAAPFSTWPSTCDQTPRPISTCCRGAQLRATGGRSSSRRAGPWLSDPCRRHRGVLPDGCVLRPGGSLGARWDDPAFAIDWPAAPAVISERDRTYPDFVAEGHGEGAPMDMSELSRTAPLDELGRSMFEFMAEVFPICRSITGAGLRETLGPHRRDHPAATHRSAFGHPGLRLDGSSRMEHRRCVGGRRDGERVIDFRTFESSCHELQRSGRADTDPRRAASAPAFAARTSDLGSLPNVLLRRGLGLLPERGRSAGHVCPGDYEAVIDATLEDGSLTYGECVLPGLVKRRDPHLEPRLPSVPCQRQPVGRGRRRLPGQVLAQGRSAPHLPLPLCARHDRRDHLAGPQRGPLGQDPRRARAGLCGRPRTAGLQAEPAWLTPRSMRPRLMSCTARHQSDEVIDFSPYGNDERQFCSPGFDLPVGAITRSGHDRSERHHTLGRRPGVHRSRSPGRLLGRVPGHPAHPRGQRHRGQPQPKGRAAARSPGPVPAVRRPRQPGHARVRVALGDELRRRRPLAARCRRAGGLPFDDVSEAALALEKADLVRREAPDRDDWRGNRR